MRLVFGKHLVAEGRYRRIEGDGIVGGFQVVQHFKEHQGEDVDAAHYLAAPGG